MYEFRNKRKSAGNPFNFPLVERMIQHIVAQHVMRIREDNPNVQQVFQAAKKGRKIDRVYG